MRKFTKLASLCLALFSVSFFVPNTLNAQIKNVAKMVKAPNGDTIPFLEYRPAGHDAAGNTRKYPVIIFLHGGGEKSDSTSLAPGAPVWRLQDFGPSRLVKMGRAMSFTWNNKVDTFIVLSPMSRKTLRSNPAANANTWAETYVDRMVKYAKDSLKSDTNRIFLTGLSFGGGGTFRYLSYQSGSAKKLAAAAPICAASPNFTANGANWVVDADLPVWGFHASNDPETSPVNGTINPIASINNHSPAPDVAALKTIWSTGGHIIWDRVYDIDKPNNEFGSEGIINIYEWFLGQDKSLPFNQLPTANAGNNFNVSKNLPTGTLNGSASFDPDGNLVRYFWRKVTAPAGAAPTINTPRGPNPTTVVSNLSTVGAYTFRLYVLDDRAGMDSSDVVVNVVDSAVNQPPIANAGPDKTITLPVDSVRLFGSASDPGGSVSSLLWQYISGPGGSVIYPNASAQNPIMKSLTAGVYNFRLKVTDNLNAITYDTVKITVLIQNNTAPVANAGSDQTITHPVDSIRIYGGGTDDGTIVSYQWTFVSGPTTPNIFPNNIAQYPIMKELGIGVYVFALTVKDNDNAFGYDTVKITVNAGTNIPPIAGADDDVTLTLPEDSVRLLGTAADADGSVTEVKWFYVDGPANYTIYPNPFALNPIMKDLTSGTYHFRIRVTDNDNAVVYDTVQITVLGNVPPIANAGPDKTITLPVDSVRIFGSMSDPDGTVSSILWQYVSGPSGSVIYPNASAQNPIMKSLVEGVYFFRFKVTDNENAITYDTVKITVNAGSPSVLDESTATELNAEKLKVSVYPNPGRDMLNITLNSSETGRTTVSIYDVKGSLKKSELTQKQSSVFQRSINIHALPGGMYYVHVIVNGKRHIMKFIKQ